MSTVTIRGFLEASSGRIRVRGRIFWAGGPLGDTEFVVDTGSKHTILFDEDFVSVIEAYDSARPGFLRRRFAIQNIIAWLSGRAKVFPRGKDPLRCINGRLKYYYELRPTRLWLCNRDGSRPRRAPPVANIYGALTDNYLNAVHRNMRGGCLDENTSHVSLLGRETLAQVGGFVLRPERLTAEFHLKTL